MPKRTAFFISDSTGITAETLGHTLLSQFTGIEFNQVILPYIDTPDKAHKALESIHQCYIEESAPPIIIDTIVLPEIRKIIASGPGVVLDIFGSFIAPLEKALGIHSSYSVGTAHSGKKEKLNQRMAAVHHSLMCDDGLGSEHYSQSEVILVGVSRCGKTPTAIYLAMQFGIFAANYPIVEDDLEDPLRLPKQLVDYQNKLFGLNVNPERLAVIRKERRDNKRYASLEQCAAEVNLTRKLFQKYDIPWRDTTVLSTEEIATHILQDMSIRRDML